MELDNIVGTSTGLVQSCGTSTGSIQSFGTSTGSVQSCGLISYEFVSEPSNRRKNVIPAKAGIQLFFYSDYHTGFSIPD
jgi:hypothetical protein